MSAERELKFSLVDRPPPEADLVAVAAPGPYAFVPMGMARHLDRYFDDDEGSLAAAGVALRRREAEGGALAALKTMGTVVGALHVREELEAPMAGDDWPMPVARRMATRKPVTISTQPDRPRVK